MPPATYLKAGRASLWLSFWSCFGWGLHGSACYQTDGSLLSCLSTLTWRKYLQAVYFCCTGLGVASTGRYPASCPVKPGLSSPTLPWLRSPVLLTFLYSWAIRFPSWKILTLIGIDHSTNRKFWQLVEILNFCSSHKRKFESGRILPHFY